MSTSRKKQKAQGKTRKTKPNGTKLFKKKPMRHTPKYLISGFSRKNK